MLFTYFDHVTSNITVRPACHLDREEVSPKQAVVAEGVIQKHLLSTVC